MEDLVSKALEVDNIYVLDMLLDSSKYKLYSVNYRSIDFAFDGKSFKENELMASKLLLYIMREDTDALVVNIYNNYSTLIEQNVACGDPELNRNILLRFIAREEYIGVLNVFVGILEKLSAAGKQSLHEFSKIFHSNFEEIVDKCIKNNKYKMLNCLINKPEFIFPDVHGRLEKNPNPELETLLYRCIETGRYNLLNNTECILDSKFGIRSKEFYEGQTKFYKKQHNNNKIEPIESIKITIKKTTLPNPKFDSDPEKLNKINDTVETFFLCCDRIMKETKKDITPTALLMYEYANKKDTVSIASDCLKAYCSIRNELKIASFNHSKQIYENYFKDHNITIGQSEKDRIPLSVIYKYADKFDRELLIEHYLTIVFYTMNQSRDGHEMLRIASIYNLKITNKIK